MFCSKPNPSQGVAVISLCAMRWEYFPSGISSHGFCLRTDGIMPSSWPKAPVCLPSTQHGTPPPSPLSSHWTFGILRQAFSQSLHWLLCSSRSFLKVFGWVFVPCVRPHMESSLQDFESCLVMMEGVLLAGLRFLRRVCSLSFRWIKTLAYDGAEGLLRAETH